MKFKKYLVPIFAALLLAPLVSLHAAVLGLDREAYGVWDREGGHSVSTYPYTRGQEYSAEWTAINPARSNFNWTAMDSLLQFAYNQNQRFFVKIQPVTATTVPPWIFSAGVPQINTPGLTYGYYLDPEFKLYFEEMVKALGKHLREEVPAHLANIVSFVRVDTGATGDEGPYDPPDEAQVPAQYLISEADWRDYRIWVFGLYDQAFQHGAGPLIPLIFQNIETPVYQIEQNWVMTNVTSGFGAKYGGQVRGHHLSESKNVPDSFKAYAMDTTFKFFSANEMDQTWEKFYFQLNVPLSFYWCAVESLNAGLSIQDWSGSAVEGAAANNFEFAATFFNEWAAELDPPTARGGFCIFHEGLDSADTNKFPEATYGSPAKMSNSARYTAICAAYASQGAQMDHLLAATWGQVAQRRDQNGFNDSGWEIWAGNYDRFITQIDPDNTSLGLWRVRGTLTTSSHPYDRFARRFDSASGRNTMYFDVNDNLTPTPGQSIQLSVVYLDSGAGQFGLLYDAVGNSQKTAFTVTKSNSNNWKTNSAVVTDWVFGNNGPNGSDLVLTNLGASGDTTFHMLELTKLADVNVGTVGKGTVRGRTDATVYAPVMGTFAERQRLELTVTPAPGWVFTGWSGELSGTNTRPFLFPTKDSRVTANFAYVGGSGGTSVDDFDSGTFTGGTGWSGGWSTSGTATPTANAGGYTILLQSQGIMTRALATPLTNATLSFNWDIDNLESGESGLVEVSTNGTTWQQVWSKNLNANGADVQNSPDALLTTNINLNAYGRISHIRFYADMGAGDRFWIDDVSVTGSGAGTATNTQPLFSSDPVSEAPATVGVTYAATLSDNASDPGSNPLTFSKLSGPAWLNVATNGVLSGNPTNAIVGLNSWLVRITNGVGGSDDAILLINVNATVVPSNSAPVFTLDPISRPEAGAGVVYSNTLAGSATDVDAGDPLTYSKLTGPAWLSLATNGTLSGMPGAADVGTNVFTVKVADAAAAFDTATLNIVVQSAYTVWANQYPLVQGSNGNDDGDHLSNLGEFAFGGNPTNSSDLGYPITFVLKSAGGTNWLEYVHPQRSDPHSGLLYYLELATNLISPVWTNAGYTVVGSGSLTTGFLSVTNRIETNLKAQQFIRLVVEEP